LRDKPSKKFAEIRLGFCVSNDHDSYDSLEQHASQLTHVCADWMTVTEGTGSLHVEEDLRIGRLAATNGLVLMPMLTNLADNTWYPEAVENLATGPAERQNKFIVDL